MKAIICKNCGASNFFDDGIKTICTYCHTKYQRPTTKFRSRKNIWLAILGLSALSFVIVFYLFTTAKSNNPVSSTYTGTTQAKTIENPTTESTTSARTKISKQLYARQNINSLPGWTIDIYNNIHVAAQRISQASAYPTYENGGSYTELEALIGTPPTRVIDNNSSHSKKLETTAEWDTEARLEDGAVKVMITYETRTGQIVRKMLMGTVY
ncbi:MAG: TFIIB-type zinc finger domain-containing protein [Streptococcaceae bacterium]|jgi:hypothetical protein|nr:TFIIB-type zinc finger domain-containing protein [Streptococcaceae bacterium]